MRGTSPCNTREMADVDIDPFGEHESRTDDHTETGPFTPVGGGSSTWEPEQETSFRGESQRTKLMKDYVKDLYKKAIRKHW